MMPFVAFLVHAAVFRNWLIEDAGISFSYARNLAYGHGLVAQPGLPPVEAYSNFLWVLLLTPFFVLRIFQPVLTLKALSVALVAVSYALLYRTFAPVFRQRLILAIVLTLLGLNTAFVVWTTSGLENPLYALLLCGLMALALRSLQENRRPFGYAIALAGLAIGLAMTRPEGILFAVVYPALVAAERVVRPGKKSGQRERLWGMITYAAAFSVFYGGLLAFRLIYFGELMPNTYYAKGGPSLYDAVSLLTLQPAMVTKALSLVASVAGRGMAGWALLAALIGACYLVFTGKCQVQHLVVGILLLCATSIYLLSPDDGMGEYRFGTPFIVTFYLFGGLLMDAVWEGWRGLPRLKTMIGVALAVVLVAGSLFLFVRRSAHFAEHPPVPFAHIVAEYGQRYDGYAIELGVPVEQASVLLPDLGGTLYTSRVRIYDLGMLADKTIARTLMRDQQAFYDYVFEVARLTFIHVHDVWSYLARLDDDPRFRRDYVPLYEYPDAWAKQRHGLTVYAGDYVRKDVLNENNQAALMALRARWARFSQFNQVLYLQVAGQEAEAEQVYRIAVARATVTELQQALRSINAFLTIYPSDPRALALRAQLESTLARK